VALPTDDAVMYVVVEPDGYAVTTDTTSHPLAPGSSGEYAVRARIDSGWRSQPAIVIVSPAAQGSLYACGVP
jgi:hypothetical protein